MSESDVALMWSWSVQLARSPAPLDFWYEHMWDPEIDYRAIEGAPDDVGPILGREAMLRYLGDWYETFDGLEVLFEDVIDAGDGLVITMFQVSGRAKASGVPIDMRLAIVWTIHSGKIVRGREYLTREEALAAVGLAD